MGVGGDQARGSLGKPEGAGGKGAANACKLAAGHRATPHLVAHPLREGNGRAMRARLDSMPRAGIGRAVDWSRVDREDCLLAMERSPVRGVEIKAPLKPALTDAVNDCDAFMKGIDASYAYEGYTSCSASELGR